MNSKTYPEVVLDTLGPENLSECGIGCIANRKDPGYLRKVEWLRERFPEGLRILLIRDRHGTPLAFLEYVPGAYAWRPVHAEGWLFIHCLWVYSKGRAVGGLGSRLIQACIAEAQRSGARGVATVASTGPWMADARVFLRNGFERIAERDGFELLALRLRRGPAPRFQNLPPPKRGRGLHIVYAAQCPFLPKSAEDVAAMAREHGLDTKVTALRTARQAQEAPCDYGVFHLIWNGRLLSDHYVSRGRIRNILRKDILADGG